MALIGVAMLIGGGWLLSGAAPGPVSLMRLAGILLAFQGIFQIVPGLLLAVRGRVEADIELRPDAFVAFAHTLAARPVTLPLADVRSVMVQVGRRGSRIFVGGTQTTLVVDSDELARPEDLQRLALALREALRAQPDGEARLRTLDRQVEETRLLDRVRPWATWALITTITLAFGLQLREHALEDPVAMLRLGAGSAALVAEGEWFRLFSANFLHAFETHLILNGLGLWLLGALLERLLGPWRLIIIYLASALGGAVASTLWDGAPIMMGASTAVFGLAGGLWVTERVFRWQIPPIFRQSIRLLSVVVLLNLVVGFTAPLVDQAAHLGGFATGMGAAWLVLPRDRKFRPLDPGGFKTWLAAVALAAAFGAGLIAAARNARDFEPQVALAALLHHPTSDPGLLNNTAWMMVARPETNQETLEVALAMADKALAAEPGLATFLDTRGGALYRLGRVDEAIVVERSAFAADPNKVYAAHLERMLGWVRPVLDTTVVPEDMHRAELRGGPPGPVTVLGTYRSGHQTGFFIARAEREGGEDVRLAPANLGLELPEEVELEIRWVGASLPAEVEKLRANEYQAWLDVGAGELP